APAWPDEDAIRKHQDNYAPFSARMLFPYTDKSPTPVMPDRIENRDDFKKFVDAYDGAIRYMDEQLGALFAKLESLGVMEDTAIIISADHGEAMGEHGVYGDHVYGGEAGNNIPMIIRWPGSDASGRAVGGLGYHVGRHRTQWHLLELSTLSVWV